MDIFAALIPLLIVLALSLLVGLVFYIFQSIGLYKMAKTCGISAPGLAWVPLGNMVILGKLAQRGSAAYGKRGLPYSILLPLGTALGALVMSIGVGSMMVGAIQADYGYDEAIALIFVVSGLIGYLVGILLLIAACVLEYCALYQVYRLFIPENAVIYTVLSILVNVTLPFLLFSLHNRQPFIPTTSTYVSPAAPSPYAPPVAPVTPATPVAPVTQATPTAPTAEQPPQE